MRRFTFILFCLLSVNVSTAFAQKKRNKTNSAPAPTITLDEAMKQYRFEEAKEILVKEIESLSSKNQNTEHAEEQLEAVERAQNRLNATEQVVFIDSLVVPAEKLFEYMKMSDEVGSVYSYNEYFNEKTNESSVFLSQLKDKIYFAQKDEQGRYHLYSKDRLGSGWSDANPLKGLVEQNDTDQNYPFMLSDGQTLYFAAKGDESIGGYDIFMTRYDVDEHAFLTPENIGMPFNSPANDYLYMIDDYLNLGWFVTDRNQEKGNVCIYTFIPNETRKIYNSENVSQSKLRSFAKINSIKDTWKSLELVNDALSRLEILKEQNSSSAKNSDFLFIINDKAVYSQAADFHSAEARKKYGWWQESKRQLIENENKLEELRQKYTLSKNEARQNLATQIHNLEQSTRKLKQDIKKQEKEIRRTETAK